MSDNLWEDCCYATGGATIIMTAFRLMKSIMENHNEEREPTEEEYLAEFNRISLELRQEKEIKLLKEQIANLQLDRDPTPPVCGY